MSEQQERKLIAVDVIWTTYGGYNFFIQKAIEFAVNSGLLEETLLLRKGIKVKFGAVSYLGNVLEITVSAHEGDWNSVGRGIAGVLGGYIGFAVAEAAFAEETAATTVVLGPIVGALMAAGVGTAGFWAGEKTAEDIYDKIIDSGNLEKVLDLIGERIKFIISNPPDPEDPPKPEDPPLPFDPSHYKNDFEDMKNTVSPIALDLDGDGMEFIRDGAYFDYDASGFAEKATWLAKDDGWLVLDRNGDGVINDGSELFGDVAEFIFRSERRWRCCDGEVNEAK